MHQALGGMFYWKHEDVSVRAGKTAGSILRDVNGSVKEYVDVIRLPVVILKLGRKRATTTCPEFKSMRLRIDRGNAVVGYLLAE